MEVDPAPTSFSSSPCVSHGLVEQCLTQAGTHVISGREIVVSDEADYGNPPWTGFMRVFSSVRTVQSLYRLSSPGPNLFQGQHSAPDGQPCQSWR